MPNLLLKDLIRMGLLTSKDKINKLLQDCTPLSTIQTVIFITRATSISTLDQ
jgi:hypothetical protein